MERAQRAYGPFAGVHEAMGVALEEWDELREAVHRNDWRAIRDESLDLAAALVRLAEDLEQNNLTRGRP